MDAAIAYLPTFTPESAFMARAKPKLMELDIAQVEADPQVRKTFKQEAIDSLAESLKAQGQIVSVLAYLDETRNKYILIDGERRYRAAIHAKLGQIRAEVWAYKPTEDEIASYQVAIDYHRESLDPIEQAAAFRQVMQANGWSGNELAKQIKIAHTTVSRALSLLELPEDIQGFIRTGELSVGVARELARIEDVTLRQTAWAKIQSEEMNAKQAAAFVTNLLKPKAKAKGPKPKNRYSYRNLSGFDASVTPRKIVLTATKKARTPVEILAALETLVQRYRDDVVRAEVKVEADAKASPGVAPTVTPGTPEGEQPQA